MNDETLRLERNGDVVRERDGKTVARVCQTGDGDEIRYAHHTFARYAEQIVALMEDGPEEDLPGEAVEEDRAEEQRGGGEKVWKKGDPQPVMTPEEGDLTPEYVEWAKVNLTAEEFRKRYRGGFRLIRYEKERKRAREDRAEAQR